MWGEDDDFGVPANMFGFVPEDFIRAMGRIVMLSALVENVFSHVVMTLARVSEDSIAGWQMSRLAVEFDRVGEQRPPSERLLAAKNETVELLARRNELVHSLWPFHGGLPPRGWRPVTASKRDSDGDHIKWIQASDEELRMLIKRLVAAHSSLQGLFGSGDLD